jgi:hypothetical protein
MITQNKLSVKTFEGAVTNRSLCGIMKMLQTSRLPERSSI